jgi:hypothetical protein
MWGLYLGLDSRHGFGGEYFHIIDESDLNIIIDTITGKFRFNGHILSLVRQIRKLLSLRWQVLIGHT